MRIPEETRYKEGDKHIEDRTGYVFCPHCFNCVIISQNQIYNDGAFYCFHLRKWKRGDDLIEYMCEGYEPKTCDTCTHKGRDFCKSDSGCYMCKAYRRKDIEHHGMFAMGRVRQLSGTDIYTIRAEEQYVRYKKKEYDNKRNREDEIEQRQLNEKGDEQVGYIQVSYTHKKDKIRFPFKKKVTGVLRGVKQRSEKG